MPNRRGTRNTPEATIESTDTAQEGTVSTDTIVQDTQPATDVAPADQAPADQVNQTDGQTDAAPADEKPAATKPDLTAFEAALATAIEATDTDTGTVPDGAIRSVGAKYAELDRTGKRAAMKQLDDAVSSNMDAGAVFTAKSYFMLSKALPGLARSSGTTPATPADPTEAFVQAVVISNLAYNRLVTRVPEDVNSDWAARVESKVNELADQLQTYVDWMEADTDARGDEPQVTPEVRAAVKGGKVSRTKGTGTPRAPFTGTRRNVATHIRSAFADLEIGAELTVGQIVKHRSAEYGDDAPSQGAVSSRLSPTSSVEGVESVEVDGHKGARKIAA